ncbi:GAF domain-containing sensor histidine kinase [Pedobacter sp. MC2016-15]|uniref:GAF domain-containing sensor histidine kinase n=1 Tax=Pedobacter sp. MC2016-15 TaxID=2994473 RepID=UPI002245114B|nr:GAF domain-containing sensor histidine kinase [Pedobacter sp. MC2016-15]MCX2481601.1 GAF domain-containing sensor histidine kinase [Pedobacter sp. MC2016-15]
MESYKQEEIANIQSDIVKISRIPAVANILEVACEITGMGFAAIARVTESSWVACATKDRINFGLGVGGELKLETTICNEIMQHHQPVAIDHADLDPTYKNHHTPNMYGLQSYISVPIIRKNGKFFGTLCAIDRVPNEVNNIKVINTFSLFAELIGFHLDSQDELDESSRVLKLEQRNAEIREQFIAMLGHDLRNPVNAISNAVQLQLRGDLDDRNKRLAAIINDATTRTKGLINNILDFASGKLGGGIKLNYENDLSLDETIQQVITELNMAWPEVKIIKNIDLSSELKADYKRIAQLLSNILGNAITHGEKGKPIQLSLKETVDGKTITVSNSGLPIPASVLPHLFMPYSRGKVRPGQEGLGLGLYISKEIVLAHGGSINVISDNTQTEFTILFPA